MSKKFNIAVVGATGVVGETLVDCLDEFDVPVGELVPLASSRSVGKHVMYKNKTVPVLDLDGFDFSGIDIALFSAGASVSADYAPKAAEAGAVVIDNTSHFRYHDDIPLVVSQVNPEAIADYKNRGIIANPNCSTMQMLVALKPIYDAVGISRINVATYQAVSGTGKQAIEELAAQTSQLLGGQPIEETNVYPKQIAFNVIPWIDGLQDNGYTKEEMKMYWETKKIFGDDDILVNATAARVPVFLGHSEAVHIETKEKLSVEDAEKLLKKADGVTYFDRSDVPTAVSEAANNNSVFVGRLREDISHPLGLNMWVVSDNVRKGAATNSVEIAQLLIKDYL